MSVNLVAKESFKGILTIVLALLFSYLVGFQFGVYVFIIALIVWIFAYRNPERIALGKKDDSIVACSDGEVVNVEVNEDNVVIEMNTRFLDSGFIRAPLKAENLNIVKTEGLLLSKGAEYKRLNKNIQIDSSAFKINLYPRIFELNANKLDSIQATERLAFMKYGIVRLEIKHKAEIFIRVGDRLKAAQSIIGQLK